MMQCNVMQWYREWMNEWMKEWGEKRTLRFYICISGTEGLLSTRDTLDPKNLHAKTDVCPFDYVKGQLVLTCIRGQSPSSIGGIDFFCLYQSRKYNGCLPKLIYMCITYMYNFFISSHFFCVRFDFETRAFMAWASKILLIILRLEHHTLAYYYSFLRLEHSLLEPQRLWLFSGSSIILEPIIIWLWGSSIHDSSLKDYYYFDFEAWAFMAWASKILIFSGLLLCDFDARLFMARASKIIIILTLWLEHSWLKPQRLLCLIIIRPGYGRHDNLVDCQATPFEKIGPIIRNAPWSHIVNRLFYKILWYYSMLSWRYCYKGFLKFY